MSEFTQIAGNDETFGVSNFGGNLSSFLNESSSADFSGQFSELFRYAKKLQIDGELERSLRLKIQADRDRLSCELQRARNLFRRDKKAAKRTAKIAKPKSVQRTLDDHDSKFEALRIDKGLFLEAQQLRRDLKFSNEDRKRLRKEASALKSLKESPIKARAKRNAKNPPNAANKKPFPLLKCIQFLRAKTCAASLVD
jgi:hypothetical protein